MICRVNRNTYNSNYNVAETKILILYYINTNLLLLSSDGDLHEFSSLLLSYYWFMPDVE